MSTAIATSPENFIMQLTNAGVLVDMDGTRILIDPFSVAYKGPLQVFLPFAKTTASQAWKITYGEGAFHHIDLLLISHDHIDHFSHPLTVKFLRHHPETTVIAREYLLEEIQQAARKTLTNTMCGMGDSDVEAVYSLCGVRVRAWATQHAGSEEFYRSSRHTTYRLEGRSWSLLFLGDMEPSEENFDRIQTESAPDAAIVPYLYGILRKGEKLLHTRQNPGMTCYNHIPAPEGEAKAWRKAVYTRVACLRERGESRIILDQFGMTVPVVGKRKGVKNAGKNESGG